MCIKAVDDFETALKFAPDWFVTTKMIKKLLTALYADYNILYFNVDSSDAIFSWNKMGILNIDLNNINLDEDDSENIIHIRLLARHIKFKTCKALKNS